MAQRIPRDESLSRVHGVGALFAAAYGNVGSSIYYALGVTAAFALGLTPVAFVISGLIFAATAATYAEATVMFPEAGGSSSFARHAFNELVSSTNAGLIGVSRLTYSMGQHRQLPEGLRQVHPKYRTPYIAILIFAAIAILTLIPGQTDFLATMYSFGAMLSFTIAHIAVIQTAVLGGLGTFAAWIVVMALNPRTLIVGTGWMALGILVYVLYRRNQGLPLTETVKVLTPEPLGVEEIEYRSVLVAFEDDQPFSEEVVATAIKLASKRRRGIHVHSMLTVPTHLPLNAELPEQEGEAQSKIEQAKLINAAAVVVGLRYRNGRPLYDKTLQTVLGERPCRVIVVSEQGAQRGTEVTPALA